MNACPEAATLGAFVEATLDDETRLRVQRHVADCSECAIVVAQTSRFLEHDERDAEPSSATDWRWLAAAAAVAALILPTLLWRPARDPLRRVKAIAANTKVRTMEGRLEGFVHRPFSATRSERAQVEDVAIEAQRLADGNDFHARGVAALVAGNPAEAVEALRRAVAMSPERADAWSDLAVAEIALASSKGNSRLFDAAIRSAERAIALAPRDASAHFNRGVAAERLGRMGDARVSYRKALDLEPSSAWTDETRERLIAVEQ